MNVVAIIFGSMIVIVGMVLTYKLLTMIIDRKNGGPVTHRHHRHNGAGPNSVDWQELAERAQALDQRLRNLEEILHNVKEEQKENVP